MDYQISPLLPADGAKVIDLMTRTENIDHHTVYTLWQSCYFDPELFLAAKSGTNLCGYIFGRMAQNRTALLWQVAVDNTRRQKGVGRALVTQFLKNAAAKDVAHVITTILPDNEASHRLMKSSAKQNGFAFFKTGETGDFGTEMKTENIYCFDMENGS